MPLYEFEDDQGLGVRVNLIRPIKDMDRPLTLTLKRRKVPSRISVVGGAQPATQASEVMAGYYKQEQKNGARFRSRFTKEQIKNAWSTP